MGMAMFGFTEILFGFINLCRINPSDTDLDISPCTSEMLFLELLKKMCHFLFVTKIQLYVPFQIRIPGFSSFYSLATLGIGLSSVLKL